MPYNFCVHEHFEKRAQMTANTMPSSTKDKVRDGFWDFVKGLCIFGVFYVHSMGGWNFNEGAFYVSPESFNFNTWFVIRCAMMGIAPLFFFISGYLTSTRKEPLGSYYKRRAKRVILPFLAWSGVYTAVAYFVYGQPVTFLSFILGTNAIQLYFLVVMIQLTILTPFLVNAKNKELVLAVCMAITIANSAFQVWYWATYAELVPNEMILCTCFIGYYYLGHYFRTRVNLESFGTKRNRRLLSLALLVAFCLLLVSCYWVLGLYDDVPIAGSFNTPMNIPYSVIFIAWVMSLKGLYADIKNKFASAIERIGMFSMEFFAVHWLFMSPMKNWIIANIPKQVMWLDHFLLSLITFALCVLFIIVKQKVMALALHTYSHHRKTPE